MKTEFIFRKATACDESEILRLYHSLIGTEGCTWNLDYPSIDDIKNDIESASLYCLCSDDVIVAVGAICVSDEFNNLSWSIKMTNHCEFSRIGVRGDMQKKGLGKIILKHLLNEAKTLCFDGIRMIVSKTNVPALSLYNKNGFSCFGEVKMFGIDFLCYELSL